MAATGEFETADMPAGAQSQGLTGMRSGDASARDRSASGSDASVFRLPAIALLGALIACAGYALTAHSGGGPAFGQSGLASSLSGFAGALADMLGNGAGVLQARAPALGFGLVAALALVPLAFVVRGLRVAAAARNDLEAARLQDGAEDVTGFARPRRAYLDGPALGAAGSFTITYGLARIGRADDNEIVLDEAGLESYHAAIERTPECDTYLCDLTRGGRRAARVNGKRINRHRLAEGDVITLGAVTLKYRTSAL